MRAEHFTGADRQRRPLRRMNHDMSGTKKQRIAGWVISVLVTLFTIGVSAVGKFTAWPGKEEMFGKMGFTTALMTRIGVVEVVVAVLTLIPQTAFIGAILMTAYLGGAVVTHLRVGEPFFFPIVLAVVMWIGQALRQPEILRLARGASRQAVD
jgi:hypothetical protein